MPRRPKPKNTLSAGERVALYQAEQEEKQRRMREESAEDRGETLEAKPTEKAELVIDENADVERKVKKSLPKPQHATVRVDFSIPVGEIKPMHGMCNGPVSYGADISGLFREIGVPYVRFDGTDTAISSYAVDISRIFRHPEADPSDEKNYDFSCTDRYVEAAFLSGARVIFRLGESKDLFDGERNACISEDPDALSRVCVNVIRHYNDGWASGYTYGISHFEIWNHDDSLSGRELEREFEMYRRLAGAVKLYDESLLVGGMSFSGFGGAAREFLRMCKKTRAPMDFITVDCFGGNPEGVGGEAEQFVALMRNLGFADAEVIIGKWSYIDGEALGGQPLSRVLSGRGERFHEKRRLIFEAQRSVQGAAYCAALMLRLSQVSGINVSCFYDAQPMLSVWCAISDRFGTPEKPFYAFKAFGELYRARSGVFCDSEQVDGFAHTGVYAGAAVSDNGDGWVMLASYGGCGIVDLRLDGIPDRFYSADIYLLDGVKNLTLGDTAPISGMKKRLLLNVSEYGVVLVKLY